MNTSQEYISYDGAYYVCPFMLLGSYVAVYYEGMRLLYGIDYDIDRQNHKIIFYKDVSTQSVVVVDTE